MRNSEMVREALRRARTVQRTAIRNRLKLANEVQYATGVSIAQMQGHSRETEVVQARWAAMYAMRTAGHSYSAIGRFFNRDHTSVMHAVRRMEAAQ